MAEVAEEPMTAQPGEQFPDEAQEEQKEPEKYDNLSAEMIEEVTEVFSIHDKEQN